MNIQTTHNIKQTTKLSILLLAALATCGLLAAACGASQTSTDTTIRSAVAVEAPTTAGPVETTPTTAAVTTTTTGDVAETVPPTAAPATVVPTTISQPGPPPGGGEELDSQEPCFAKLPADPAAAQRQAEALLPELQTLFPALSAAQAGNLAFPYVQCGVTAADIKAVLAEGELGSQYRRLVAALGAESYRAFLDTYLAQPCLLGAHDFGTNIKPGAKLKELIGAVSGAALIQFEPGQQEMEDIAKGLLTEMMNSFQQALETGGEAGGQLDNTQPVTCEEFAKSVAQRLATS